MVAVHSVWCSATSSRKFWSCAGHDQRRQNEYPSLQIVLGIDDLIHNVIFDLLLMPPLITEVSQVSASQCSSLYHVYRYNKTLLLVFVFHKIRWFYLRVNTHSGIFYKLNCCALEINNYIILQAFGRARIASSSMAD